MSELINYSMGLRSNRVDPLLTEGQCKKQSFPEARARRNSFSSKENTIVEDTQNNNAIAKSQRKTLSHEFEKNHHQQQESSACQQHKRKTNPDALKQSTQERTVLGKKMSSSDLAGRGLAKGAPFFRQTDSNTTTSSTTSSVDGSLSTSTPTTENSQRFANSKSMNTDHFSKDNSALPCRGASSPKKQGLKFMQGPPEFVAEKPEPKIRHTHSVRNARGAGCTMAGLVQQQQQSTTNNNSTTTTPSVSVSRRGSSSASYNIITGQ